MSGFERERPILDISIKSNTFRTHVYWNENDGGAYVLTLGATSTPTHLKCSRAYFWASFFEDRDFSELKPNVFTHHWVSLTSSLKHLGKAQTRIKLWKILRYLMGKCACKMYGSKMSEQWALKKNLLCYGVVIWSEGKKLIISFRQIGKISFVA